VDFYRGEMRRRYRVGHIRRFREFDPIDDRQVDALREFFFAEVYVPGERRHEQDAALDLMLGVFLSPLRAAPLAPVGLQGLRALGRQAPKAMYAAQRTLVLYERARALELLLLENARRARFRVRDTNDRDRMLRLVATVPEHKVRQIIGDVLKLFETVANLPMMEAGLHMLDGAEQSMRVRTRLYGVEEAGAVAYVAGLLRGALKHLCSFSPAQFKALSRGILAVEMDWYEGVLALARR
jgi:hypothetical protein